MKVAIYPGTFDPWHEGHLDVLKKALKVFDRVIVAQGVNSDKGGTDNFFQIADILDMDESLTDEDVEVVHFSDLLPDYVSKCQSKMSMNWQICAVIRGLRNGDDLQYEMNQQYWYEDLGLNVPVVYFITDRRLSHISSSAIRKIEKFI